MFNNIGTIMKTSAKFIFILAIISSIIILANSFIRLGRGDAEFGFILIPVSLGILLSCYITSLFLYGIGEIIDKLNEIEENTRKSEEDFEIIE